VPKAEARQRLGLDARSAVLLSFGGIGLRGFRAHVLEPMGEFQFLIPDPSTELPPNARAVSAGQLSALGLGYEDVVGAADVVVSKPGYGIVTDAIGARTRLVYTDRGDFPEYGILVDGMTRYLPCTYLSNDDVRAGLFTPAVRDVLELPFPPRPDTSGAARAAETLVGLLGR
jgi:hypothetical protein